MIDRREFLQVAAATAALVGTGGGVARAASRQALTQEDLLRFEPKGQVTLLHMTDVHAQLKPLYFREPRINLGVGEAKGLPPHLTGAEFLKAFAIPAGSRDAYMLSADDFNALAREYGRVGGMDRMATLVNAIRAQRGASRTLLLDGGDLLQGSFTALESKGADMIAVAEALGIDATTGHWEFTLGAERITELYGGADKKGSARPAFLAGNVVETDFEEPVFHATRFFDRGGVTIAVIGQAFPYTPVANPAWMMPKWSFGIREGTLRRHVKAARAKGADIVVLLSHNGFDVDRKLASRVAGIDVILTGHTHDALPVPVKVGNTLLVASGSHGKFLSRLDLEVKGRRVVDYRYALIPVLADAITPDPTMVAVIDRLRAPHVEMLATELAHTDTLLYRRGNFNGTLDDLICDAMLSVRRADICLSPGFRWGSSLLPGQAITWEDVYNATAITYPACYTTRMSGDTLKAVLEDVADNVFNPDPYYQQGGDMVRVGGMSYTIQPDAPMGQRISDMRLEPSGDPLEASHTYRVTGWGAINPHVDGPPIWDVVASYLKDHQHIGAHDRERVRILRS
jgi:sulfur-oxidizing protein SoxB